MLEICCTVLKRTASFSYKPVFELVFFWDKQEGETSFDACTAIFLLGCPAHSAFITAGLKAYEFQGIQDNWWSNESF